ncbi:hypothetical protein ACMDXN_001638 [Enterococcus faecium]|nr:hypothetical protein [Enterococcus hirae]EME7082346.1 hypothetical protein [Enterococcus faecium]EMF0115847.1 hypothetical protein [Enterococcus hirae]EMF0203049.1 hypothetical protein [Enterococcus hirae]
MMKVLDKVTGSIVEIAFISRDGKIYQLINSNGVYYKRFSREVEIVKLED